MRDGHAFLHFLPLGIVHLDLKPENFVIVRGMLKLIDLGISQRLPADCTHMDLEKPMGSLVYMSPEQLTSIAGGNFANIDDGNDAKVESAYSITVRILYFYFDGLFDVAKVGLWNESDHPSLHFRSIRSPFCSSTIHLLVHPSPQSSLFFTASCLFPFCRRLILYNYRAIGLVPVL